MGYSPPTFPVIGVGRDEWCSYDQGDIRGHLLGFFCERFSIRIQRGVCKERVLSPPSCFGHVTGGWKLSAGVVILLTRSEGPEKQLRAMTLPSFLKNFYFILGYSWFTMFFFFVSGVQQSDLVIHIHISILFQILFPCRLLQNIE